MSTYFYLTLSCLEQCVVLSIILSGMIFSLHTRFMLYPETCSNFYILLSTSFLCKPLQFDSPSSSSKSPSHTLKLIYWKSPPIKFNIIFSIMFFVTLPIALYITDFLFSFKGFFFFLNSIILYYSGSPIPLLLCAINFKMCLLADDFSYFFHFLFKATFSTIFSLWLSISDLPPRYYDNDCHIYIFAHICFSIISET